MNTRTLPINVTNLHIRECGEGEESRTIEGHAVVFGVRSVNLTPWSETREVYEIMERGCIDQELIDRSDIVLTAFHDNQLILGRSRCGKGTLQCSVDDKGLLIRCDMPKTNTADDMLELIKRGDISGMSFAFTCNEESDVKYTREPVQHEGKDVWIRSVSKVSTLHDVTIAGHPAYEQTDVARREVEAMNAAIDNMDTKPEPVKTDEEQQRETELEEAAKKAAQEAAYREKMSRIRQHEIEIERLRQSL